MLNTKKTACEQYGLFFIIIFIPEQELCSAALNCVYFQEAVAFCKSYVLLADCLF